MELQTVEVPIYTEARKLQENLEGIKADLMVGSTMAGIEIKTTKKEALMQQGVLKKRLKPTNATFRLGWM
jgi:hypothetical protein